MEQNLIFCCYLAIPISHDVMTLQQNTFTGKNYN